MIMSKEKLIKSIREIPDFPIPGILFYDVTTLFKDSERLQELSDIMYEMYKDKGITKVVGIESRGFIMGPILATRLWQRHRADTQRCIERERRRITAR